MNIYPFKSLRPDPRYASEVACVPYDTVNRDEAIALAQGRPRSFLHVVRPDINVPATTPPESQTLLDSAAAALKDFQRNGSLIRDEQNAFFLYQQRMGAHVQRGVVACCDVEDYRRNRIVKHEKTRRDKEDDRARHVLALQANTGPVFLTYRDEPAVDGLVHSAQRERPLYDFVAEDGVAHTVWRLPDVQALQEAFEAVPAFYIADGHHRAAAAARAAATLAEQQGKQGGDAEYNRFLTVLFPGSQLQILPYNRVVHDLNGCTEAQFMDKVKGVFRVTSASGAVTPTHSGRAGMFLGGQWFCLQWDVPDGADPVDRLDVSVLQQRLLEPVLGIEDPRTSTRIDFVGGIRGTRALEKLVEQGEGGVAFSLAPVTVEQMMTIADAGREMPPKSTWFEPKLRSGLLIHPF